MTIGETIHALRVQNDIAMGHIQKTLHIKMSTLGAIENDNLSISNSERIALARLFNIKPDDLTANSPTVLQILKPDQSRVNYATELALACNSHGYAMVCALDTCQLANNPNLFDKNTTRYIPAIKHSGFHDDWKKAGQYFRIMATYDILYWSKIAQTTDLTNCLNTPEFEKTVRTAMLLQDLDSHDISHTLPFIANLAKFYTAYKLIDLQPGTDYDIVEQKLNALI